MSFGFKLFIIFSLLAVLYSASEDPVKDEVVLKQEIDSDDTYWNDVDGQNEPVDVIMELAGTATEGDLIPDPLFPRQVGLANDCNSCYINSIVFSLYTIPIVQKAFYADFDSHASKVKVNENVVDALTDVFAKMRAFRPDWSFDGRRFSLNLNSSLIPALNRQLNWNVSEFECVIDFWTLLQQQLPQCIKDMFKVDLEVSHLNHLTGEVIKSSIETASIVIISPSEGSDEDSPKLRDLIEGNFVDETPKDYVIQPEDQHEYAFLQDSPISAPLTMQSKTTMKIVNTPEILVFGIRRGVWDRETSSSRFVDAKLKFYEKLTVNEVEYRLVSTIVYDPVKRHYLANTLDFGNDIWYEHDDAKIRSYPDDVDAMNEFGETISSRGVMAFYVKRDTFELYQDSALSTISDLTMEVLSRKWGSDLRKSQAHLALGKVVIPRRILMKASAPTPGMSCRKRKPRDIDAVDLTFEAKAPVIETLPVEGQSEAQHDSVSDNEIVVESTEMVQSSADKEDTELIDAERVSKQPKISDDPVDEDGSRPPLTTVLEGLGYSFIPEPQADSYLPLIIQTISRIPHIYMAIFASTDSTKPEAFEFQLSLVILKILLNQNDISLEAVRNMIYVPGLKWRVIYSLWERFVGLLPPNIVASNLNMKAIIYEDDETDEPREIILEPDYYFRVDPRELQDVQPGDYEGIVIESIRPADNRRLKRIFSSTSPIISLPCTRITRNTTTGKADIHNQKLRHFSSKYYTIGSIFFDGVGELEALIGDCFDDSKIHYIRSNEHHLLSRNEAIDSKIASAFAFNSVILFFMKRDISRALDPITLESVPKHLIDTLLHQI